MLRDRMRTEESAPEILVEEARQFAHPLKTVEDLDPLIKRIGDALVVLLSEASHGTSEYYQWRARLSRRLITVKGFSFVAVEGDQLMLFDTEALHPLHIEPEEINPPDTYPWGF